MKKLLAAALCVMMLVSTISSLAEASSPYPWPMPEGDEVGTETTHAFPPQEIMPLFENHTFTYDQGLVHSLDYYIYDPVDHGADPDGKYPPDLFLPWIADEPV